MDRKIVWLRGCYWFGAAVDGLMVIPMLNPSVAEAIFGIKASDAGLEYQFAMLIGASLMLGWTALLLWADRKPVERKGVLLLTVFPVVVGLIVAGVHAVAWGLISVGDMAPTWVIQAAIVATFTSAYRRAGSSS